MESPTTKTMQDVEATTLKVWLERGEALLIDVREPPEYAAEHIPDARLLPLSPRRQGRKWSCTALWVCAQRKRGRSCSTPVLRPSTISVEEYKHGRMPGTPRHVASGHH
jgi:Rhodanese-like domain